MSSFLAYLTWGALILTGVVLVGGLIDMVRGKKDRARSNALMRYRVVFQGLALLLFAALAYYGR